MLKQVTLILILIVLSGTESNTQNASLPILKVESSEAVDDAFFDCRDIENRDVNGNCLAGIIIESNLTNLVFNPANGFMPDKQQVVEGNVYRLYVSQNERKIEIISDGFLKFDLILSSEGVRLREGRFWKVVIGGVKAQKFPVNISVLKASYS